MVPKLCLIRDFDVYIVIWIDATIFQDPSIREGVLENSEADAARFDS